MERADQVLQVPKKEGPYRIALANGFIANTWRIQMIKNRRRPMPRSRTSPPSSRSSRSSPPAKDVAAQIAAINNFIDSGYDAIIVNAQNPKAFGPVIKRAKDAGVVLIAFDNILDTEEAINVNVDQKGLGVLWANWLIKHIPNGGKILEVRGVAGTSVDTDRHNGIHETLDASGKKWDVVEVVGKWDDPTAQKVTADALAVNGKFDGFTAQGGDTGVVQAMIDAKQPWVPFGGETENGFRKFCGKFSADGLKCSSAAPARPRWRSPSRPRSTRSKAPSCRSRSSCRSPSSRIRTSRTARTTTRTSPTTSSSATPSRPAGSTSLPRKSWAERSQPVV